MTPLLTFGAGLAGVVASVAAVLVTMLVLRNPRSPRWLRTETAAQTCALALVAIFAVAVGRALSEFVEMDVPVVMAALIAIATLFASACLFWAAFRIGERLRRADSGRSPFDRIGHDATWTRTHSHAG